MLYHLQDLNLEVELASMVFHRTLRQQILFSRSDQFSYLDYSKVKMISKKSLTRALRTPYF